MIQEKGSRSGRQKVIARTGPLAGRAAGEKRQRALVGHEWISLSEETRLLIGSLHCLWTLWHPVTALWCAMGVFHAAKPVIFWYECSTRKKCANLCLFVTVDIQIVATGIPKDRSRGRRRNPNDPEDTHQHLNVHGAL